MPAGSANEFASETIAVSELLSRSFDSDVVPNDGSIFPSNVVAFDSSFSLLASGNATNGAAGVGFTCIVTVPGGSGAGTVIAGWPLAVR